MGYNNTVSYFCKFLVYEYFPIDYQLRAFNVKRDINVIKGLVTLLLNMVLESNEGIPEEKFKKKYNDLLNSLISPLKKQYNENIKKLYGEEINTEQKILSMKENIKKCHLNFFTEEQKKKADLTEFYAKELELISKLMFEFIYASATLDNEAEQKNLSENQKNIQNNAYLLFMEFLLYYSSANIYFDSPVVYLEKLNKAISYLKQSVLFLYRLLIILKNYADDEYLKLLSKRLGYIGNNAKLVENVFDICDFYKKKEEKAK